MPDTTIATKPKWGKTALGSFSAPDQIAFVTQVYGWMFGGLMITAAIAFFVAATPVLANFIFGNIFIFFLLVIAELTLVFSLAGMSHKMSAGTASAIFIIYSALNGLTLSVIFFVYTTASIGSVFLIAAGIFGIMSLYGFFTKKDLTTIGSFAIMTLLGLVIAMFINLFFHNNMATFVLACVGVLVFVILTAFDTQKLKWYYALGRTEGAEGEKKEAINGALALYLDFINLFLDLLMIFGKRR